MENINNEQVKPFSQKENKDEQQVIHEPRINIKLFLLYSALIIIGFIFLKLLLMYIPRFIYPERYFYNIKITTELFYILLHDLFAIIATLIFQSYYVKEKKKEAYIMCFFFIIVTLPFLVFFKGGQEDYMIPFLVIYFIVYNIAISVILGNLSIYLYNRHMKKKLGKL